MKLKFNTQTCPSSLNRRFEAIRVDAKNGKVIFNKLAAKLLQLNTEDSFVSFEWIDGQMFLKQDPKFGFTLNYCKSINSFYIGNVNLATNLSKQYDDAKTILLKVLDFKDGYWPLKIA